uniref:Methyltransferase domain-containing protein n=1 Tax=Hyaloperonospora arabidopsidis (strain Emoy2) TaxID=559515 RepID=M4BDS1_HYAAE
MASSPSLLVGPKLAPFTPSGDGVLTHALDLLALSPSDVLFDLGCGDARMLVHAAEQTGARGVGVEYNGDLVKRAQARIEVKWRESGVMDLVDIRHGDALEVDLTTATAMFLYLVPRGIQLLLPKYDGLVRSRDILVDFDAAAVGMNRLEEARRLDVRFVTYMFSIPGWKPTDERTYKGTKVRLFDSLSTYLPLSCSSHCSSKCVHHRDEREKSD